MKLASGKNEVVGMSIVAGGDEEISDESRIGGNGMLLTGCEGGYGKRTKLEDYPRHGRC